MQPHSSHLPTPLPDLRSPDRAPQDCAVQPRKSGAPRRLPRGRWRTLVGRSLVWPPLGALGGGLGGALFGFLFGVFEAAVAAGGGALLPSVLAFAGAGAGA